MFLPGGCGGGPRSGDGGMDDTAAQASFPKKKEAWAEELQWQHHSAWWRRPVGSGVDGPVLAIGVGGRKSS